MSKFVDNSLRMARCKLFMNLSSRMMVKMYEVYDCVFGNDVSLLLGCTAGLKKRNKSKVNVDVS